MVQIVYMYSLLYTEVRWTVVWALLWDLGFIRASRTFARGLAARREPAAPARPSRLALGPSRRLGRRGVESHQGGAGVEVWSLEPQAKGPPNETDFGGPSAHKSEPTSW